MRKLLTLAAILMSSTSYASGPLEFRLVCEVDSSAPAAVRALQNISFVKNPVRGADGRWENRYSIQIGQERIELTPAGSGDEDYNEYEVVGENRFQITGAAVQNRFAWASILVDGSSLIDCR